LERDGGVRTEAIRRNACGSIGEVHSGGDGRVSDVDIHGDTS
jgi:hypothetical protein